MRRRSADIKLMQAFFRLLETKSYSKISVSEIVTQADLSRTTFYRYYTDVYDMYDKISAAIVGRIIDELVVIFSENSVCRSELLEEFCERLETQKRYIRLLSGENGGKEFYEIVTRIAFSRMNENNARLSESDFFAAKFVLFSGIATYVKTLLDGTDFDSKYLEMYKRILADAQEAGRENE